MIVSSLVATKRFKVTENRDRADAILKGVALEKTSQEVHAYGEGTSVEARAGAAIPRLVAAVERSPVPPAGALLRTTWERAIPP